MPALDLMDLILQLETFSPRLFANQTQAANFIKALLDRSSLPYQIDTFNTLVPKVIQAKLFVDNQPIPCASTSLVSGILDKTAAIIDSTTTYSSRPNLNYNSRSNCLSRTSHYFLPSLAFSRLYLSRVTQAKSLRGQIEVTPTSHLSQNILVGNLVDPQFLVFTHFDCLEKGAMDNSSGVAVVLATIISHPTLLSRHLFILSSDEELSLDKPNYWGKGYRQFKLDHPGLLQDCRQILVVDSLGLSQPHFHRQNLNDYFPLPAFSRKTQILSCSEESQWAVYHSQDDTPDRLHQTFLTAAQKLLLTTLND